MLKAIAYRPAQALVLAALSSVFTAVTVIAPLYQRALEQAEVDVAVQRAPASATTLRLTSVGLPAALNPGSDSDIGALTPEELLDGVSPSLRRSFYRPLRARFLRVTMPHDEPHSSTGPLVWREGACAHLEFAAGRCPSGPGEIAVSSADADNFRLTPGARIRVRESQSPDFIAPPVAKVLTVTAVYRTPHDRYWGDWRLTGSSGTLGDVGEVLHDSWITDETSFTTAPFWRNPSSRVDLLLDRKAVGVDELLQLGPELSAFRRAQKDEATGVASADVQTGLPSIADVVRNGRNQARVMVPALMVPLGGLGLVVLWMALGAAAEQRRPEVAVARIHGWGVRGAQAHLARELIVVVLAGVPVGVLGAVGLCWLARRSLLSGHAPLELRVPVWSALALALVVLLGTTLAVTRQVSREPVIALLRHVPARRPAWRLGTADAAVVTVAASIVGVFATGRLTGPVALAAPGVIALALGLVLARIIAALGTRSGWRLVNSGVIGFGVGLLQVARRPGTRGVVALVSVSAAILVFVGDAVVVGARNRDLAAAQQVGAPLVATVLGGTVATVREAIADAKPPAGQVTPVVIERARSDIDQTTMFVDPLNFGRVAALPDRRDARQALHSLTPPTADPVEVVGSFLTLTVGTQNFYEGSTRAVQLSVDLLGSDHTVVSVPLGPLRRGTSAPRTRTVAVDCAAGCVLTGWRLVTSPANAGTGGVTVGSVHTELGSIRLGSVSDWRNPIADGSGIRAANTSDQGLEMSVTNPGLSELALQHRWVPDALPAVVSGSLPAGSAASQFRARGIDGVERSMRAVARIAWLPAAGPNASVSDLDLAGRTGAVLGDNSELELWFAHDDRQLLDQIAALLKDRDISITHIVRTSAVRDAIADSAVAWSLDLGFLVGATCVLVACVGLIIAGAATWRTRARELAILRMNGVPPTVTRQIALAEQLSSIGLAVPIGAAGGVLATRYALPTLPMLPAEPQVNLVDLSVAWGAVVLLAAATLVVLCVTGFLVAGGIARRATLGRVVGSP